MYQTGSGLELPPLKAGMCPPGFGLETVKTDGYALYGLTEELQRNRTVVLTAAKYAPSKSDSIRHRSSLPRRRVFEWHYKFKAIGTSSPPAANHIPPSAANLGDDFRSPFFSCPFCLLCFLKGKFLSLKSYIADGTFHPRYLF